MNFEAFQKAWQCQKPGPILTTSDPEALLRDLRVTHRLSNRVNLMADIFVVGVEAILVPYFLNAAIRYHDWAFYVMTLGCLFIGVFILADRWVQRRRRPITNDTLLSWARSSLVQVKHELWRSRNIFWWYVMPLEIGFASVAVSRAWRGAHQIGASGLGGWTEIFAAAVFAAMCGLLGWFICWLTQRSVRKTLEPRRKELEELLAGLNENLSDGGHNRAAGG
jgi:hypothetical protein